jgi:hypothetical protein
MSPLGHLMFEGAGACRNRSSPPDLPLSPVCRRESANWFDERSHQWAEEEDRAVPEEEEEEENRFRSISSVGGRRYAVGSSMIIRRVCVNEVTRARKPETPVFG